MWLVDPFGPTKEHAEPTYRYSSNKRSWWIPVVAGVALLLVSAVGWTMSPTQFYFSYLVGWTFCLSLSLGALFFVLIQHLTKARWSVAVRRIAETLLWGFPLIALLSVPIVIGMHDLYHWAHHDLIEPGNPAFDPIIAGKSAYLNIPFFVARLVFYFTMWTVISYRLYKLSILQDVHPDPAIPARQRKVSGWGLPVVGITTAFASYDLLLSLDPHWFSTIFGIYFFSGAFLTVHALIALLGMFLQKKNVSFQGVLTTEHYHDLGKMLFGFTVFWAYIAYSQYMLYWYGNIPEETIWYRHRLSHGWEIHSAILLITHFIIPFVVLLPRFTKRLLPLLAFMCGWFFVVHWFDLHWLSMPALHTEHAGVHWLDISCWLGLFALFVGTILFRVQRHAMVPQHDPYLKDSFSFINT